MFNPEKMSQKRTDDV